MNTFLTKKTRMKNCNSLQGNIKQQLFWINFIIPVNIADLTQKYTCWISLSSLQTIFVNFQQPSIITLLDVLNFLA